MKCLGLLNRVLSRYGLELRVLQAKCIVMGCVNRRGEGGFNGDMCTPCHGYITQGLGTVSQARENAAKACYKGEL